MASKACLEGQRRRRERLESLRKHHAERESLRQKRRLEANQNGARIRYLDSNGKG